MFDIITALWRICGIAASVYLIWYVYRKTHPKPCDTCKWLKMKGYDGVYRYRCMKRAGGYDNQPEYCANWEKREEDDDDYGNTD